MNENKSKIKVGVPQGSALSPILRLLYINDISRGEKAELVLFAETITSMRRSNHVDYRTQKLKTPATNGN